MIYTMTLNPAVDHYMTISSDCMEEEVNRASNERYVAGGKGLNVSKVLNQLFTHSIAIAPLGGFTGNMIVEQMGKYPYVDLKPVLLSGSNRMNVKMTFADKIIAVNGTGPVCSDETMDDLLSLIADVKESDIVVVCGSMLKGIPQSFLLDIAEAVHAKNALFGIDMEGLSYEFLISLHPDFIKPNLYEFNLLMGKEHKCMDEIDCSLEQLYQDGVSHILLSLGKDGALFYQNGEVYKIDVPSLDIVNEVGCGDAMFAGFLSGYSDHREIEDCLQLAGACGCAQCMSIGDISSEVLSEMYDCIHVKKTS